MRRAGLVVQLLRLGDGEIVRSTPVSELLPTPDNVIQGPASPSAVNCRMLDTQITPRSGYTAFANVPATSAVSGLFQAIFDLGATENLRSDAAGTYWYNGTNWASITAAGTGNAWAYAMVRRAAAGVTAANQVVFCGGGSTDNLFVYTGSGAAATSFGSAIVTGARAILGHRGRGLYMNAYDVPNTTRRQNRVWYSIVGNPLTLTGVGSGTVDLDDDAYPISTATVTAGNIVILKGSNQGGSVVVGTLTGNVVNPYRWDTINTNNVGILARRSLQQITTDLSIFLGNDGFYLHDGGRTLAPLPVRVSRDILARINYNRLDWVVSWYKQRTGEYFIAIPTGASDFAEEVWVINIRERRTYGPYSYANYITAATPYTTSSVLTIDTIPGADIDTIPFTTIDSMGGSASSRGMMYGTSLGHTWTDDDTLKQDGGGAITMTYYTPTIRAANRMCTFPDGSQRPLEQDAVLTLRTFSLFGIDAGPWSPYVEASVDNGGSWEIISDGTQMGTSTPAGKIARKTYDTNVNGTEFQFRISYSTTAAFDIAFVLNTIRLEFSYSGNARSY